jgi:multifunctional methyltransferase subunit TRM112
MLAKINWAALKVAAESLSVEGRITQIDNLDIDAVSSDEDLLKEIHHLLFEIQLKDGWLVCPTTARKFPVKDGIPNMLLHEDEV